MARMRVVLALLLGRSADAWLARRHPTHCWQRTTGARPLRDQPLRATTLSVEDKLGTTRAPELGADEERRAVAALRSAAPSLSDAELAWFARDRRGDVAEAAPKCAAYVSWRRNFGGLGGDRAALLDAARSERRKRVGYLARERDVLGRPAVVVVARRHDATRRSLDASKALCLAVLEDAVASLEGDGEQFLAVVDLRDVGPPQVDIPFVLWLVHALRSYYPKRLGQVALVDPPTVLFESAWSVIKPAVGRHAKLVRLISNAELRRDYFPPNRAPRDLL